MFNIFTNQAARRGSMSKAAFLAILPLVAVTVVVLETTVFFFHGA